MDAWVTAACLPLEDFSCCATCTIPAGTFCFSGILRFCTVSDYLGPAYTVLDRPGWVLPQVQVSCLPPACRFCLPAWVPGSACVSTGSASLPPAVSGSGCSFYSSFGLLCHHHLLGVSTAFLPATCTTVLGAGPAWAWRPACLPACLPRAWVCHWRNRSGPATCLGGWELGGGGCLEMPATTCVLPAWISVSTRFTVFYLPAISGAELQACLPFCRLGSAVFRFCACRLYTSTFLPTYI